MKQTKFFYYICNTIQKMDIKEKFKSEFDSLSSKNSQISNLKKELLEQSSTIFDNFRKEFFNEFPEVKSFAWNQYTPYFNDGSPCVFSANTDYLSVNGECAEDSDWYDPVEVKSWGTWNASTRKYEGRVEVPNTKYNERLSKATDVLKDFLSSFDDNFYVSKFGDHVEVVVTPGGIETEDYEHD